MLVLVLLAERNAKGLTTDCVTTIRIRLRKTSGGSIYRASRRSRAKDTHVKIDDGAEIRQE
jgi:hypothetical protein